MAKKNIRILGKKALSLLLTLTMVTGMLQIPAMAASSDDQIMDGYYVIDEEGNHGLAEEGVSFVEQDGFTLSKTIDGTARENEFEITLTVETSETIVTSDAAVQLVIDTSSSMRNNCGDCRPGQKHNNTHRNRLEAIKDILNDEGGFLDSLATANTGKVYVSVVYFNAGAGVSIDWTDIKAEGGLAAVKAKVEALPEATGTNIHAGLMLARNRLGMDVVKNAGSKHVVLLSDGEAHHSSSESNSTTSISGGGWGDATNLAKGMADQLKQISSVYAVGYGVQKSYLEGIVGKGDHVLAGDDAETVGEAFANIAQSATEGMSGAGAAVTDPMGQSIEMGQYILLDLEEIPAELAAQGVTKNGNGISWELNPDNACKTPVDDNTTKYTYSITYPIKLDTSVPGFKENTYYPTNGHTYLSVPQADGSVEKISFLVPGVSGTVPSYEWSVEYYLQTEESINDETPAYELDDVDEMGEAKLWTNVDAPEGYEDVYNRDGYHFASGDTRVVISKNEENNVIRLYYDLDVAPVTEKHYYKTTIITPAGETVEGEYVEDSDKTSTEFAVIGKVYKADEQLTFGGVVYEFDYANPETKSLHVKKNGENLVELFYSRVDDQRVRTTAQVDHVYIEFVYELNEDGLYELVEKAPIKEEKVQYGEELPATSVYAVSAEPLAEYADYELNPEEGDYEDLLQEDESLSFVLQEEEEDNVRTLYFEKVTDQREEATVTVRHHYTKHIVAIENGEVVNYNDPDDAVEVESFEVYVGERFEAEEVNDYLGDTYESDETNAGKLEIASAEGGEVIDLHYELSEYPEEAEVTANHYWRTFTEVTMELTEEVIDAETGETTVVVIGTTTEIREHVDHAIEGIRYDGLYVGQKHVEAQKLWGEGYDYNEEESNPEVYAGDGEAANLYYDKAAEADERSEAEIIVRHNYTTYWTTVVDGEIKTLTVKSEPVEENHEGLAGDEFVAVEQTEYEGNEYTRITDDSELSVILQPGANGTIVIEYERAYSDLAPATYTVDYEYRTYTMSINESGEAVWNEPAVITDAASGEGYVGQKITLDPKALEGYAPLAGNPAAAQVLKDEGNHWTFIYEQRIPLEVGSVTVNHHYKTITVAVNGTSSESVQHVSGTPVTKYVGEAYVAHAALLGFRQTAVTVDSVSVDVTKKVPVTVGAATVVDYYYEKTVDLSVPVTYSIAHEYYLYDWDGSLISASKPEPVVGTGFATNTLVVAPESSDYELTSATYNGAELESYSIVLQEGENSVVFVYEKTMPRDFANATVIHNYYTDEAAMQAEDPQVEKQYVENLSNLPEGSNLTAQKREDAGYVFYSADPESMEIVVTDSGENIIVLNYIRAAATYKVIHIYNCNGKEEARTSETFGGLAGDVIAAESIARVTEHNGKNYRFVSISGDIVLDPEVVDTIELVYNRTVFTPKPNPKPDPKPNPEPEIPGEELILPEVPTVEIPEEEVPLADLPDVPVVEIPDEEVPLAEVPKTGDETMRFVFLALASALGLAGLQVVGRKREEEEI